MDPEMSKASRALIAMEPKSEGFNYLTPQSRNIHLAVADPGFPRGGEILGRVGGGEVARPSRPLRSASAWQKFNHSYNIFQLPA